MFEAAVAESAHHTDLYNEQKRLSEQLRSEQRKNHFAEMFHEAIPLKEV